MKKIPGLFAVIYLMSASSCLYQRCDDPPFQSISNLHFDIYDVDTKESVFSNNVVRATLIVTTVETGKRPEDISFVFDTRTGREVYDGSFYITDSDLDAMAIDGLSCRTYVFNYRSLDHVEHNETLKICYKLDQSTRKNCDARKMEDLTVEWNGKPITVTDVYALIQLTI